LEKVMEGRGRRRREERKRYEGLSENEMEKGD
jgi:hypothetical protein